MLFRSFAAVTVTTSDCIIALSTGIPTTDNLSVEKIVSAVCKSSKPESLIRRTSFFEGCRNLFAEVTFCARSGVVQCCGNLTGALPRGATKRASVNFRRIIKVRCWLSSARRLYRNFFNHLPSVSVGGAQPRCCRAEKRAFEGPFRSAKHEIWDFRSSVQNEVLGISPEVW